MHRVLKRFEEKSKNIKKIHSEELNSYETFLNGLSQKLLLLNHRHNVHTSFIQVEKCDLFFNILTFLSSTFFNRD